MTEDDKVVHTGQLWCLLCAANTGGRVLLGELWRNEKRKYGADEAERVARTQPCTREASGSAWMAASVIEGAPAYAAAGGVRSIGGSRAGHAVVTMSASHACRPVRCGAIRPPAPHSPYPASSRIAPHA